MHELSATGLTKIPIIRILCDLFPVRTTLFPKRSSEAITLKFKPAPDLNGANPRLVVTGAAQISLAPKNPAGMPAPVCSIPARTDWKVNQGETR